MKPEKLQLPPSRNSVRRLPVTRSFLFIALVLAWFALSPTAEAGSATWLASPVNGDWNTAGNWTIGGPPNGPSDTATFATSNQTGVSLSAGTEVNGITFHAGASAFTITANPTFGLTISGAGIINTSGISQNFVTAVDASGSSGGIQFLNSATAGSGTAFTNDAAITTCGNGGVTFFNNTSTAGSATIINNGTNMVNCGGVHVGGVTWFVASSTAGRAKITNNAGQVSGAGSGGTFFINTATAGNASIINKGAASPGAIAGNTSFSGNLSSAGSGNITNDGATASGASGGTTYFGNA